MFRNYLKVALRHVWRNKVFTLINVIGLSLAISICLAIFLLLRFEQSFDDFHADRAHIYRVCTDLKFGEGGMTIAALPVPAGFALKDNIAGLEVVAPFHLIELDKAVIKEAGKVSEIKKHEKNVITVTSAYFELFKYEWIVGSPKTAFEKPFQVVLTDEMAKKYFPASAPKEVYGKSFQYLNDSDTVEVTVAGIVKKWEKNTDFAFTDFVSFSTTKTKWKGQVTNENWGNISSYSQLFIKVNPRTDIKTLPAKIRQFLATKTAKSDDPTTESNITLQPLTEMHFNPKIPVEYGRSVHTGTLDIVFWVGLLLLAIGCVNFVNLSTAQASQRAKEVGIRKAMGSTSLQLVGQFMLETTLILLASAIFSWLFLQFMLEILQTFLPNSAVVKYNWVDLVLASGVVLLITIPLAGFYPAFVLSRAQPVQTLRNQIVKGTSRKAYLRKMLIIFQFTTSQAFIILLFIIYTQVHFMMTKDLGFKKDNVLYFYTPWNAPLEKKQVLYNELIQLKELKDLTMSGGAPSSNNASVDNMNYKDLKLNVQNKYGDDKYIEFYGLKLLAGRSMVKSDSTTELVVNETFVRNAGLGTPEKAVGKLIKWQNKMFPIVGVLADFHVNSLHSPIPNLCLSSNKYSHIFQIKATDRSIIPKIAKIWKKHYPANTFEYKFLDETINKFYESDLKLSKLVGVCVILAVFISCMGLFGLSIFTTTQRTKEIGIRKIHGASIQSIVLLLSRDFLTLILCAFVIASGISYWLAGKFLEQYKFTVDISWWIFAATALLSSLIALFTVSYQAIKVARGNPIQSLRHE